MIILYSFLSFFFFQIYRYVLFSIIPPFEFDTNVAKKVAPLTFVYVMMLALNNLCLKYVEVTFYQVHIYIKLEKKSR